MDCKCLVVGTSGSIVCIQPGCGCGLAETSKAVDHTYSIIIPARLGVEFGGDNCLQD